MTRTFAGYVRFLWAGLATGFQTGAIVPSQRFLIERMLAPVPTDYRGRVIELGAGNGVLTKRLAEKCPKARVLGCEINPALARDSQENLAVAGLDGRAQVSAISAQRLLATLGRDGERKPDFIISGIPLGTMSGEKALALIEMIHAALPRQGMYIQFQYSIRDRSRIMSCFAHLRTVPAFLNFPPAFVYYAWK